MQPIYKYIGEAYVDRFLSRGEVLFRPLSWFRSVEDQQARGDSLEGHRVYSPSGGLQVRKMETGEDLVLQGWAFRSFARESDIFIFSCTLEPNELMQRKFGGICVEIFDPLKFSELVRNALKGRQRSTGKRFLAERVTYYSPEESPLHKWGLPEFLVTHKTQDFEWQREFRFAFARNGALAPNALETIITSDPPAPSSYSGSVTDGFLRIGGLGKIARLHAT